MPSTQQRKKAVALLHGAIEQGNNGDPANFNEWREHARVALRVAYGEADKALERFDEIAYSLGAFTSKTPDSAFADARRRGVRKAIAQLSAAVVEIETLEPEAPSLDASGFHPWAAGMAASLWDLNLPRKAVEEAARAVEVALRAKLGFEGGTAVPLVSEAFSNKPPTPTNPRLRFPEFTPGTDPWTNAHEGAGNFGRGCFQRIRNLVQHGAEPTPQEALEMLAAFSLLARWIDEAEVETVP